jgi:hypothetical protein
MLMSDIDQWNPDIFMRCAPQAQHDAKTSRLHASHALQRAWLLAPVFRTVSSCIKSWLGDELADTALPSCPTFALRPGP